ncbi:MAG: ABC transporter [Catenulispora sp. 13_1_20CM_3_70_7]|nr:MAG: ABC transporter [Catenulispora sp. 13_1_20CM_3_70_7]
MDTTAAVRGQGISKYFGEVVALDRVDLEVAPGRIHGLVGPNGAGKTTLLGLLLGLAVADEGRLEILGTPVGRALSAPAGIAGFVDGPGLYPTLTARQNLTALASLRHRDGRTTGVEDALDRVGLTDVADDKVRGFSLGMRQRLPAGKKQVHAVLNRLAADGATVVLSSHRMDDLEALCSEVTILNTGRVVFSGPLAELSAENSELDYRLRTPEPRTARQLALTTPGVSIIEPFEAGARQDPEVIVVRALVQALDELVARLVRDGVAIRELAPVVSPLEAAFLALTEQEQEQRLERGPEPEPEPEPQPERAKEHVSS